MVLMEGDTDESHYMGYLVLQSSDTKKHDVIDGQQRLTTLSIIILAAVKRLQELVELSPEVTEKERNEVRAKQFRETYIGFVDPVTFVSIPKLTLNRHNNDFYQNFMVPLRKMPLKNLRASEHSLRKALDWFYAKIKAECTNGEEIAILLTNMVDKLFFTTITVTDELNAYKVFETLNARGVKLSSTDLLKNFLFSTAVRTGTHQIELDRMEALWERTVGVLGSYSFPDFLRCYWNSQRKLVRKNALFKTIKREISEREAAFELMDNLHTSSEVYVALMAPQDSFWNEDERNALEALKLFHIRQHLPLLLSAFRQFYFTDRRLFTRTLRYIAIIAFRYNVISNMHATEQERIYAQVARGIHDQHIMDRASLLRALAPLYVSDASFATSFSQKEFITTASRSSKIVRYILFQLESKRTHTRYDMGDSNITIEHVYPQNPDEDWDEADKDITYLIANMTLLEKGKNKDCDILSYEDKRPILSSSGFSTSAQLADKYAEWNLAHAHEHQRNLAQEATQIWRIDFPE